MTTTNQVRLNFADLTKLGLKSLVKKFEKLGCPVDDVIATNKSKRESGMLLKNFTLVFEDGQKLLIRVKYDGTVFQVKLNNKVKPIKTVDNLDKAISEMVNFIHENSDSYAKNKIATAKRSVAVKIPAVRSTRTEKIANAKARFIESQVISAGLEEQLTESQANNSGLQTQLDEVLKNIEFENERTKSLQAEIDALKAKQEV